VYVAAVYVQVHGRTARLAHIHDIDGYGLRDAVALRAGFVGRSVGRVAPRARTDGEFSGNLELV
jgi:hypothetical protein